MKIPETYEEFLKTPKTELLKISEMDIPLEVASRIVQFICRAEDEYSKKTLVESTQVKRNTKTIWEDLFKEL
jgi:hypothetical protein